MLKKKKTVKGPVVTWVRSLVQEDSTRPRATKPVCHNYRAQAPEPSSRNYPSQGALEPMLHNKRSQHSEKLEHYNQRGAPTRHN